MLSHSALGQKGAECDVRVLGAKRWVDGCGEVGGFKFAGREVCCRVGGWNDKVSTYLHGREVEGEVDGRESKGESERVQGRVVYWGFLSDLFFFFPIQPFAACSS